MQIKVIEEQLKHKGKEYWIEKLYNTGAIGVQPLTLEEYTEIQGRMNGTHYDYPENRNKPHRPSKNSKNAAKKKNNI